MKTLIVEDDFTSRLLLQQLLAPHGERHAAQNGTEAMEAYMLAEREGRPFDLICLDIMMPEMDGQAVLGQIRAYEKKVKKRAQDQVKIIMTTALGDEGNVLQAIRGSCDAYLVKPINRDELLNQLRLFNLID